MVEHVEDPLAGGHRALERVVLVGEVADGLEEAAGVLDERDEHAGRERRPHRLGPAEPDHEAERERGDDVDGGEEEGVVEDALHLGHAVLVVDLAEAPQLLVLAVEHLHDAHPGDVLLQERVQPADLLPRLAVDDAHAVAEFHRRPEHQRHHGERDERERHVQREHEVRDEDELGEAPEDRHDAGREEVGERLDVARRPRDEPADGRAVEVAERLVLDVAEDARAEVVERVLADPLRRVVADERRQSLPDEHEHEEPDDAEQPVDVALGDVPVDRDLDELGLEGTEERRGEHEHARDDHLPFVGQEEGEDAAEEFAVVGGLFRRGLGLPVGLSVRARFVCHALPVRRPSSPPASAGRPLIPERPRCSQR